MTLSPNLAAPAIALALLLLSPATATTWGESEVVCGLCDTKQTYYSPKSYGSYIYRWPSRQQLVFWPATESRAVYSCTECRFTCFMWDFRDAVPKEKREALKKLLAKHELPVAPAEEDDEHPRLPYVRIDPLRKLAVAEAVYTFLELPPADLSRFYRAFVYQALRAKDEKAMKRAAELCLQVTSPLLEDTAYAGKRKETLVILASMERLLGRWKEAKAHLAAAAKETFRDGDKDTKGYDEYLGERIKELAQLVDKESQEPPPAPSPSPGK